MQLTDLGGIVGCPKDKLRSTIVARAYVRNVGFVLDQDLGTTEIAELENTGIRIKQEVLRLNITMANSLRMDIRERAEKLEDVNFYLQDRHRCLHFVKEA